MITFPNCKINLGLQILRKRPDGYHDIDTCFYPLPFTDILEISHSKLPSVQFITTGIVIPENGENLCLKAYKLLKKDFNSLGIVNIHLHKAIPVGSGLGGGSADGAFSIKMLNSLFDLKLSNEKMRDYAYELGSDCPFFIGNVPSYATGRGQILTPAEIDLSMYSIVIVNPGIEIKTAWAFSQVSPANRSISIPEILSEPVWAWKRQLFNDFELPVFEHYPLLKEIKNEFYRHGALYASLSGSGSTLFGIFEKGKAPGQNIFAKYFYKFIP